MQASPLLGQLRQATQDAHQALDRGLALLEGSLTHQRYTAFLEGTFAVVAPLEGRVFPLLAGAGWLPDAATRPKAARLLDDLRTLGLAPRPLAVALPEAKTPAQAFGCAYVLEGSMLGGAVLARGVEARLGLHAARGTAYFHAYGDALGARWRSFLEQLAGFSGASDADARDAACAAAAATFASFTSAFRAAGALERDATHRTPLPTAALAAGGQR